MAAASTPPPKHRELSPPQAPRGKIGTGLCLVDKLKIVGMNGDVLADTRVAVVNCLCLGISPSPSGRPSLVDILSV